MDTMFERYYEISIDNTTYNMQNLEIGTLEYFNWLNTRAYN